MFSLRDLSVRSRFRLVMGLVTLSLLVLAGWSLWSARSGVQTVTTLFDQAETEALRISTLREGMVSVRRYQAEMIATAVSNPSDVDALRQKWKKDIAALQSGLQALQKAHPDDAQTAAIVDKSGKQLAEVLEVVEPVAQQLADAKMDASAALAYTQRASTLLDALQVGLNNLQTAQKKSEEAIRDALARQTVLTSVARLVLVGITLALFLPLMWLTLRSICGPLDQAVAMAARIAGGDLSGQIDTAGQDEPARLMKALAGMQGSLRQLVGQVREASQSIEVASSEVATGNADLSQRTEQTASQLQSAASQMTQLTDTVRQSADSAMTANQLAGSAAAVAGRGGEVVAQVVATMNDIHGSSRRIADIISVIDGIAFQTNILALNAAVEAARAGEQGRGFAVVAGEVRTLASRSAEAAREIKSLINASVDRVESGSRLVQDAGSTMTEIVVSVQRVTDIIGEISAASGEQSRGIAALNGAVGQLDQMTQQNAALVEESAAAAESLKGQSQRLAAIVATFRTGDEGLHAVAVVAPPAWTQPKAVRQSAAPAPSPMARPAPAPEAPRAAAPVPAAVPAGGSDDWEAF